MGQRVPGARGAAAVALMAAMLGGRAAAAEPEAFRIGLVAGPGGTPAVEGLAAIKAAFSGALGQPVEVLVARDYAALIEAQIAARVDYAVYSAPAYAAASIRCGCLRPVAAPVAANGAVGLRSVLIVRRGREGGPERIAAGPADSLATSLAPLAASPDARRAAAEGRLVSAGSAAAAEAMFLDGEVDGFFGWVAAWADDEADAPSGGSLARLRAAGLGRAEYGIGWRSGVLRHGPHAVRADMPDAQVASLVRMLERAAAESPDLAALLAPHHGGGFAAVSQDDYAAVIEAVKALGGGED